ncbi:hypothetical protein [Rhizobacter fulvus]
MPLAARFPVSNGIKLEGRQFDGSAGARYDGGHGDDQYGMGSGVSVGYDSSASDKSGSGGSGATEET